SYDPRRATPPRTGQRIPTHGVGGDLVSAGIGAVEGAVGDLAAQAAGALGSAGMDVLGAAGAAAAGQLGAAVGGLAPESFAHGITSASQGAGPIEHSLVRAGLDLAGEAVDQMLGQTPLAGIGGALGEIAGDMMGMFG